jgi:squalene-hopene/tetraprenyl-beta-curcumene cyclase
MLACYGYTQSDKRVQKAIKFILSEQEPDGSWFGRWGVNYIYGTWAVLTGLRALGEDFSRAYIQRAIRWLESCQNADGGWGEDCHSYEDPRTKGRGPSTPSQTAWAAMALIESGKAREPAVERAMQFLIERQKVDGTWVEEEYTGTGFPKHFYINYHLYRNYFPLMALARYRQAVTGGVSG